MVRRARSACSSGASLAGGTNAVERGLATTSSAQYESSEAYLVYGDANAAAGQEAPASQQFLLLVSTPNGTVDDPAFQAAIDDIVGRLTALQSTVDGATGPVFEQLVDPTTAPPQAGLVSPDRTTVRIVARVPGDGEVLIQRARAGAGRCSTRSAPPIPDLQIHALNNTLANDEISELINSGLDKSLLLTIPITFAHPADRVRRGRRGASSRSSWP